MSDRSLATRITPSATELRAELDELHREMGAAVALGEDPPIAMLRRLTAIQGQLLSIASAPTTAPGPSSAPPLPESTLTSSASGGLADRAEDALSSAPVDYAPAVARTDIQSDVSAAAKGKPGPKGALSGDEIRHLTEQLPPDRLEKWLKKQHPDIPKGADKYPRLVANYYYAKAYELTRKPAKSLARVVKEGWQLVKGCNHEIYELPLKNCPSAVLVLLERNIGTQSEFMLFHATVDADREATEVIYDAIPVEEKDPGGASHTDLRQWALNRFTAAKKAKISVPHQVARVVDYLPLAKSIAEKHGVTAEDAARVPKYLGFALALAFVRSLSVQKVNNPKNFLGEFQGLLTRIGNVPLFNVDDQGATMNYEAYVRSMLEKLLIPIEGERMAVSTYSGKVWKLVAAFEALHDTFKEKIPHTDLKKEILRVEGSIIKTSEMLDPDEHYPALPAVDVQTILDYSWQLPRSLYFTCVLQLSTCLRNEELGRLRREHLRADGLLEYQEPVGGEQLIQKTTSRGKGTVAVDPTTLINPTTSIVTRVILKHLRFMLTPRERELWEEIWQSNKSPMRKMLKTKKGHQRSLRTTGATNLRFGLTTRVGTPIDPKIIQGRLAHRTEDMVNKVYARHPPKDSGGQRPDKYFQMSNFHVEGHYPGAIEYLWDMWLLRDFLRRHDSRPDHIRNEDLKAFREAKKLQIEKQKNLDALFEKEKSDAEETGDLVERKIAPLNWSPRLPPDELQIRQWIKEELLGVDDAPAKEEAFV